MKRRILSSSLQRRKVRQAERDPPSTASTRTIAPPDYGIEFVDRDAARSSSDGAARIPETGSARPGRPQGTAAEAALSVPDQLRAGIESLSGVDLSDVTVHTNSDKPAQVRARAYAQGSDIHLATGEERHLPHEAWHLVQQRQGRVRATGDLGNTRINDDPSLESEADVMGSRALTSGRVGSLDERPDGGGLGSDRAGRDRTTHPVVARRAESVPVIQRVPVEHTKNVADGPYGWTSRYSIDMRAKEAVLTIRVQVNRDPGVTANDADAVRKQTRNEFQRQWDRRFNLRDAANKELPLRVQLEYVTANPHATVQLHAGAGRDDLSNWYVSSDATTRAHELGHQMGMLDEYVDATVPNRATAASPGVFSDNSLMGNYYTEGIAKAHVQQRHGDLLATDISATTGTVYSAVPSGIYITRDGDTLSSIAERLLGSKAKWRSLYTKNMRIIGNDPDKLRPGLVLKLP